MNRRLYFLFPDTAHARHAIQALPTAGVEPTRIHVVAKDMRALHDLAPGTTARQRHDTAHTVERLSWNTNLALFAAALLVFIVAALHGAELWALFGAGLMLTSFVAGLLFTYLPNGHLSGFRPALEHGEVLLMVDVPKARSATVERFVHQRYPEAVPGGASWSIDAFGL